jgi:hypothetical protein
VSQNSPLNKSKKNGVVSAGAAGGGLGTLLISFAEGLPETNEWKTFLTLIAPILTVGVSGLWLFVKTVYIDPVVATMKHKSSHAHISRLIEDAKKVEQIVINDPNSSQEHKDEMRNNVEKLEKILISQLVDSVEYA